MPSAITPKASRVVTFAPHARMKRTIHLKNYTHEEMTACWYSSAETKEIRQEALKLAMQMSSKTISKQECTRGLEFLTPKYQQLRMENRIRAWDVVLDEQERQMQAGIVDEESIASLYAHCCRKSAVASSVKGMSDEHSLVEQSCTKKSQQQHLQLPQAAPVVRPQTMRYPMQLRQVR